MEQQHTYPGPQYSTTPPLVARSGESSPARDSVAMDYAKGGMGSARVPSISHGEEASMRPQSERDEAVVVNPAGTTLPSGRLGDTAARAGAQISVPSRSSCTTGLTSASNLSPSSTASSPATLPQSYSSKENFYTTVRKFLQTSLGVTMWRYNDTSKYAVVICGRRQATGCAWKLRVDREGESEVGRWVVNEGMSVLKHDHAVKGAGSRAGTSSSAQTVEEDTSEFSFLSSSEVDSDLGDPSPANAGQSSVRKSVGIPLPLSRSSFSAASLVSTTSKPQRSPPVTCYGYPQCNGTDCLPNVQRIPNAPKLDDRYSDLAAVLTFYEQNVVPILGVSISQSVSQARIKADHAIMSCNRRAGHGRPLCGYRIVLNRDARRGDWVLTRASKLEHNHGPVQQILNNPTWRPRKKGVNHHRGVARWEEGSYANVSSSEEEVEGEKAHVISGSTQQRSLAPIARAPPHPSLPSPSTLTPSTGQPDLSLISSSLPLPNATTFLSTLTFFLTSVHGSLGALASTLYQGGIEDLSLLAHFVGLDEEVRDRFLAELKVGLLQRRLVRKVLSEAKGRLWPRPN